MEREALPAKSDVANVGLFGSTGVGKTTAANALTDEKFETANSGFSVTRALQTALSAYPAYPFRVVDFPGTDVAVDVMSHLRVQADALKSIIFRVICIFFRVTDRLDDVRNKLTKQFLLFRHHLANVVVILTHCEGHSDEHLAAVEGVIHQSFGIDHCFRKEKNTSGERMAHWLYSFINPDEKMRKAGIVPFPIVKEGLFETDHFANLISDVELDMEVLNSRGILETQFRKIYKVHLAEFQKSDDHELKLALYFSLKNYMDSIADEHAKKVAPKFPDQSDFNEEIIIFQNILMGIYRSFKTMVTNEIKVENVVYDSSTGPTYRQCPHCGLKWLRIYGCNSITCGKRSISLDVSNRTFYNYTIKYIGNCLSVVKNMASPVRKIFSDKELVGLSPAEVEQNLQRPTEGKAEIKPAGCGRTMSWREMKDVTKEVEEQLKEFDFSHHSETGNIVSKHADEVASLPLGTSRPSSIPIPAPVAPAPVSQAPSALKWTIEETGNWLDQRLGLGSYAENFKNEAIDGEALLELSQADLKQLGVNTLGHAKKIMKAIEELKIGKE